MSKPIWPKVPAGFVRSMLASHSALGLFLAALAYLVCVTGTVAVLAAELKRWELPAASEAPVSGDALNRAAAAAVAGDSTVTSLIFSLPSVGSARTVMTIYRGKAHESFVVGPDGSLKGAYAPAYTEFVTKLHANLHGGKIGYIVVGLAGAGMLALAISGLLAHPRILRDAFTLRWGGSKRLHEADLHNRLSVWGLPFNIAVSLTGAYLGLFSLLILLVTAFNAADVKAALSGVRAPPVAENAAPAPLPDLAGVINSIRADRTVDDEPFTLSIARPGTAGQSVAVYSLVARRLIYGELYQFKAGAEPLRMDYSTGKFGVQLYASAYRLHFGSFGGLGLKLLYVGLGFGLSVVCCSGVTIWLTRRRDQGRPTPRWERVWTATVWGTLIALTAAALGSLLFGAAPGPVFWGAAAVSYAAALAVGRAEALSMLLKAALAALLAALGLAHVGVHGGAMPGIALAIDVALAVSAAWLAVLVVQQWRRMALAKP